MWKPVLEYNKPTIAPTHHRQDVKILARVVLHMCLKTRKYPTYTFGHFDVYTGGSVIEASEDGKTLKVELDEYFADCPPLLLTFESTAAYPNLYGCRQIKQLHRLETLNHRLFVFTSDADIVESKVGGRLFYHASSRHQVQYQVQPTPD